MKSILYLMHIDWNWIKQRPQFIAEGLSKKYKVTVLYKHTYRSKGYQHRIPTEVKTSEVYSFPNKFNKYAFCSRMNDYLFERKVRHFIRKDKPFVIYVTSPVLVNVIPSDYDGKIIYDCMDDHMLLEGNGDVESKLVEDERKLLKKADIILVSSLNLLNVIKKRYKNINNSKFYIIRNGFSGPILRKSDLKIKTFENKNTTYKLGYFGTIGHWFDFDVLRKSLKEFNNIEYELWGPIEVGLKVPKIKGINYCGTAEHKDLYNDIKDCTALIMPFKLNKMIESVDPVKLYEYINFNKNILTIQYNEIERFSHFVYFYKDYKTFKYQLMQILNSHEVKYGFDTREKFLQKNNWDQRIKDIIHLIDPENSDFKD